MNPTQKFFLSYINPLLLCLAPASKGKVRVGRTQQVRLSLSRTYNKRRSLPAQAHVVRCNNPTAAISSGGEGASFPRFLLLRVNIQKYSQGWVGGRKKSNDARLSGCVVFLSFSVSSWSLLNRCARLLVAGQTQYSWSRWVEGNLLVHCIKLDLVRDRLLLPVTLNPLLLTPRLIFSRRPFPLLGV